MSTTTPNLPWPQNFSALLSIYKFQINQYCLWYWQGPQLTSYPTLLGQVLRSKHPYSRVGSKYPLQPYHWLSVSWISEIVMHCGILINMCNWMTFQLVLNHKSLYYNIFYNIIVFDTFIAHASQALPAQHTYNHKMLQYLAANCGIIKVHWELQFYYIYTDILKRYEVNGRKRWKVR